MVREVYVYLDFVDIEILLFVPYQLLNMQNDKWDERALKKDGICGLCLPSFILIAKLVFKFIEQM